MTGRLIQLFPQEYRQFWQKVWKDEKNVTEIRLRVDRPIIVHTYEGIFYLDRYGNYTEEKECASIISKTALQEIFQHVCQYSPYAYEDEIKQGFLTVSGGVRIGMTGQVVMGKEGIKTIKHLNGFNIRIPHEVIGAADFILPVLYEKGQLCSTLILSAPGCGKTTLLRDLIRQVSDGNAWSEGANISLVDERSEIAGCFQGIPQNDVGSRTDVLDACPKAIGMMLSLRAMAPQVIAVDEIGGSDDLEAIRLAASCGSKVLATIHGTDLDDVRRKEGIHQLLEDRLFARFVVLGKQPGQCSVYSMTGEEMYHGETGRMHSGAGRMQRTGFILSGTITGEDQADSYPAFRDRQNAKQDTLYQSFLTGVPGQCF